MTDIPTYDKYLVPTLRALHDLGGSATISELLESVSRGMGLTDEQLSILHNPELGDQPEVAYRMAWARTYLKKAGLIENSKRGVWSLTAAGREARDVDVQQLLRQVRRDIRDTTREKRPASGSPLEHDEAPDEAVSPGDWRSELASVLSQMPPAAFERLSQRVLRECGFVEVQVTGRTGDGGIDGIGVLRLQHVVSFQVLFQCKRWKGTVGAKEIRDFRGAMVGRTDKGLFITTGTFSRDA